MSRFYVLCFFKQAAGPTRPVVDRVVVGSRGKFYFDLKKKLEMNFGKFRVGGCKCRGSNAEESMMVTDCEVVRSRSG